MSYGFSQFQLALVGLTSCYILAAIYNNYFWASCIESSTLVLQVDEGGNDGGNNGSVVARTFLIRTKTEEDRDKLATTIQEYAPTN